MQGRRIDYVKPTTKARAGANVVQSFEDPCKTPLLDPKFRQVYAFDVHNAVHCRHFSRGFVVELFRLLSACFQLTTQCPCRFPDPIVPNYRKWLPIYSEPWYSFDAPIDNWLVRATSFVVFLTALFLFIFGVVLCEVGLPYSRRPAISRRSLAKEFWRSLKILSCQCARVSVLFSFVPVQCPAVGPA